MILIDWVLKLKLSFEKNLCPSLMLGVRKNPTFVVLCLNNEHAKSRNQYMVNLCRAVAMLERDVIQKVIVGRTKTFL